MSFDKKKYRHDYYIRNKDKTKAQVARYKKTHLDWFRKYHKKYQRKRQPKDRARVREIVKELKNVPCADCGNLFPWYVMDFDHVRGKKICEIGSMGNSVTPTKIMKEAEKCDVVCACCHRIRTYVTRRDKIPKRKVCK